MEAWELDFKWLRIQHYLKEVLNYDKLPDLNAVLLLIGIQELGQTRDSFTKEEKQDLMHIAVCTLLAQDGYFEFQGQDADDWPHFKQIRNLETTGPEKQEFLLKTKIIDYFAAETAEMTD